MHRKVKIENALEVVMYIASTPMHNADYIDFLNHDGRMIARMFGGRGFDSADVNKIVDHMIFNTLVLDGDCYCGRSDCNMCVTTVKNVLAKTRSIVIHNRDLKHTMKIYAYRGGNIPIDTEEVEYDGW